MAPHSTLGICPSSSLLSTCACPTLKITAEQAARDGTVSGWTRTLSSAIRRINLLWATPLQFSPKPLSIHRGRFIAPTILLTPSQPLPLSGQPALLPFVRKPCHFAKPPVQVPAIDRCVHCALMLWSRSCPLSCISPYTKHPMQAEFVRMGPPDLGSDTVRLPSIWTEFRAVGHRKGQPPGAIILQVGRKGHLRRSICG